MATFRCIQSGNTVSFEHQHDIDSMKGHGGYVRVDEPVLEVKEELPPPKVGRPRRVIED